MDINNRTRGRSLVVVTLAIGALLMGSIATAAGTDTQYTGCLKNGKLDEVAIGDAPAKACKSNETQITWSATGPQGPVGPTGPQGEVGPQGAQGPAGQDGTSVAGQRCAAGTYLVGFDGGGSLLCEAVTRLTSPSGQFRVVVSDDGVVVAGPGGALSIGAGDTRLESPARLRLDGSVVELNGGCEQVARRGDYVQVYMTEEGPGAHTHVTGADIDEGSASVRAC